MRFGLVADTHGYLGPDVLAAFDGCDAILHAGDVGPGVLPGLASVAPVTAVRGNNDTKGPEAALPLTAALEAAGKAIVVVHELVHAPRDGWDVLVYGHSHRQAAKCDGARTLLNPGAAGRRGFHRQRSVALLDVAGDGGLSWQFVDLGPRTAAP